MTQEGEVFCRDGGANVQETVLKEASRWAYAMALVCAARRSECDSR